MRVRRRVVVGGVVVVALVAGAAGVLFAEVTIAGNGAKLDEFDPRLADGAVLPSPAAAAGPSADLVAKSARVVWLGDSTAAGVGASSANEGVSRQVARRIGRPIDLQVLAVSGARIEDVLADQVPKVGGADGSPRPDLIVISAGANDVTHLTSLGTFKESYASVLRRLPSGVPVVMLGVPDLGSPTRLAQPLRAIAGWRGGHYDNVVRELAAGHDAGYVNIAGNTGPAFRSDPDRYFSADHYHPSDRGYGVWADAIVPVLTWRLFRAEHPNQPAPPVPKESS